VGTRDRQVSKLLSYRYWNDRSTIAVVTLESRRPIALVVGIQATGIAGSGRRRHVA
jgi:hypothetical protein